MNFGYSVTLNLDASLVTFWVERIISLSCIKEWKPSITVSEVIYYVQVIRRSHVMMLRHKNWIVWLYSHRRCHGYSPNVQKDVMAQTKLSLESTT